MKYFSKAPPPPRIPFTYKLINNCYRVFTQASCALRLFGSPRRNRQLISMSEQQLHNLLGSSCKLPPLIVIKLWRLERLIKWCNHATINQFGAFLTAPIINQSTAPICEWICKPQIFMIVTQNFAWKWHRKICINKLFSEIFCHFLFLFLFLCRVWCESYVFFPLDFTYKCKSLAGHGMRQQKAQHFAVNDFLILFVVFVVFFNLFFCFFIIR